MRKHIDITHKTGILKDIKLKHSPVETMRMLQKLWGINLLDAKKFVDYVIKHKEIDLQNGFQFFKNGYALWKYDIDLKTLSDIFDGEFIRSDDNFDFSKGLIISHGDL